MRREVLTFHWRMTDFRVRPEPMDFSAVASQGGWFEQFDLGSFELSGNDLALQGVPISQAGDDAIGTADSTAMERHLAINCLCGTREPYSETDVST